ncbi:hypothetical protein M427DRAFT_52602 [Gonapodya prolifera JEL478]|uniref:Uncharacterized protein n=1 Tax=Gonapodya prolifera (strain JEL478) TaxID=1344416 RepID=A0A139ASJ6_GONPJ|nr:hypothetical protein M427DRAFT_52602 [Gonapodya prolifera JEL478]|eukprot:KXS19716.1 hypothetical protein M427DRAFT_52602 [Gonapodya prolifera JEL478]
MQWCPRGIANTTQTPSLLLPSEPSPSSPSSSSPRLAPANAACNRSANRAANMSLNFGLTSPNSASADSYVWPTWAVADSNAAVTSAGGGVWLSPTPTFSPARSPAPALDDGDDPSSSS